MRITLPGLPPGPNAQRRYKHWGERHRSDRQWKSDAWLLALAEKGPGDGTPWQRARVAYEFTLPDHRRRDADGLVASMKPVLDGIVAAGIIVDDDIAHVELGPHSVTYGPASVTVVITRLDLSPSTP